MSGLAVRELSVRAGDAALRRAELVVGAGEVVAVVGDGGASALVRTVGGLLAPVAGSVRVAGEDLTGLPAAEVAARGVALVPAEWVPFADLSVAQNVLVGAWGDAAAAERALAALPLDPARLAGGRDAGDTRVLAVAVALARQPRLLVVDGLAAVAGAPRCRAVLAAVRVAGVPTVVAETAALSGRGAELPGGLEAADRVLVARGGTLRPWRPPADDD